VATDLLGAPSLDGLTRVGCTVARIRVQRLTFQSLGAEVGIRGASAIRVGTKQELAFAPWIIGEHQDWMAYMPVTLMGTQAVEGKLLETFDVKAMRKVEELDDTLWLASQNGAAGGNTMTLSFSVSVLLLLP